MEENTRNPIIQGTPVDTLRNVQCVLSFLQSCTEAKDVAERMLSDDDYTGLFCILGCVMEAIAHECPRVHNAWVTARKITDTA